MKILGIDTSNETMDIAFVENGRIISQIKCEGKRQHSKNIGQAVQKILEGQDFDCVVAVNSPGSYTGLRIGAAFAMGLAFGLGKPIYGVENKTEWTDELELKKLSLLYINDKWN